MSIFKKKSLHDKLEVQKIAHFKKIDDELNSPHHTPEYKNELKASWLASRGANEAERGNLESAQADIFEAMKMCPSLLIVRISAIELLWRQRDLLMAEQVIIKTPKKSFSENYSASGLFTFYDRAAAVFADMGNKEQYLLYANRALEILKGEDYARENQNASEALDVQSNDVQAFINDIEQQIAEFEQR